MVIDSTDGNDHGLETSIFTVLVGIITVLCILLNTVGIYVFMRLPRTPSNLVYLHLCVTDLIVGVFVTPYSIIILTQGLQVKNEIYCIVQGIMFEISYTTTLFILTYISLDRLLALYQPLKYKERMSARVLFWINIGTWVVPVIRPIIRYIMKLVNKDNDNYGYNNKNYLMVCYNTDYLAFVSPEDEKGGKRNPLNMLDLCIVVVACQLATLISSVLVIARLSHRLHLKRISNNGAGNGATAKRNSTLRKSTVKDCALPTVHATVRRVDAVSATNSPEEISTAADVSVREGETDSLDDSGQNAKIKSTTRKKRLAAERHAIITMVTVIVFFMITYSPSFICFIIPGIYSMAKTHNQLWIFLLVDYCTFINSTFLPMVHFSRSSGFKRQLKGIKHKILRFLNIKSAEDPAQTARRNTLRTVAKSDNGEMSFLRSGGGDRDHNGRQSLKGATGRITITNSNLAPKSITT